MIETDSFNNNQPDYEDNLAFEPKMTWEELVKKYGCEDDADFFFMSMGENKYFSFYNDGQVVVMYTHMGYESRIILAENRTPEQMKTIIEALGE